VSVFCGRVKCKFVSVSSVCVGIGPNGKIKIMEEVALFVIVCGHYNELRILSAFATSANYRKPTRGWREKIKMKKCLLGKH
jgi:hypothetical protein